MYREEWSKEKLTRLTKAAFVIPTGISYLDDALAGGLLSNDLLVVGARTGRGKTELATTIAYSAAGKGRKVVFYALEADEWEIHARLKYRKLRQLYAQHYSAQKTTGFVFPLYRDWLTNANGPEWDALEKAAEDELSRELTELRIAYRGAKFTAKQFCAELEGLKREDTDLVIIDHLHYFDLGTNEFDGLKQTIHRIRDASIHHSIPIVLLAHLRKSDRGSRGTMPDTEDFHGHSDIGKVATLTLLLSPVSDDSGLPPLGDFPTYFHLAKARTAAYTTNWVGVLGFSALRNQYSEKYYLGRASLYEAPKLVSNPAEFPSWAKHAVPAPVQPEDQPSFAAKAWKGRKDHD